MHRVLDRFEALFANARTAYQNSTSTDAFLDNDATVMWQITDAYRELFDFLDKPLDSPNELYQSLRSVAADDSESIDRLLNLESEWDAFLIDADRDLQLRDESTKIEIGDRIPASIRLSNTDGVSIG